MTTYTGNDNYGKPKQQYLDKLAAQDEKELYESCKQMIWLSAYASNNLRSDYHWQCDACYDECKKRGKEDIYNRAHKANMEAV
jgi:hypothetical protein